MIKLKLFFAGLIFFSMGGLPLYPQWLSLGFFSVSSLGVDLCNLFSLRNLFSLNTWCRLRKLGGCLVLDRLGAPGRHLVSCPGGLHGAPGAVGGEGGGEVSGVGAPVPVVVGEGVPAVLPLPLPVPGPLLLLLLASLLSRHVPLNKEDNYY